MRTLLLRRLAPAACALALAGLSSSALAQDASATPPLALDRFYAAPAGDRMFGVQSPYVPGYLTPYGALYFDYANNPLVLRSVSTREDRGAVVSDQMFLHVNASLSLMKRFLVNLDFPIALLQAGSSPTVGTNAFVSPSSAEVGDLRAGLRVRLFGEQDDALQLAVGGYVWFPTGRAESGSYVTDGGVRGLPQVIAGGKVLGSLVWSFNIGPDLRSTQLFGGLSQGTMIRIDAGAGYQIDAGPGTLQVGPELSAAFLVDNPQNSPLSHTTNFEALVDARYRFLQDFEVGVGAGPGMAGGVGTPAVRVVGMAAYSPQAKKEPPPDTDGDGILDAQDACKTIKGLPSPDPKANGCPDTDGDTIIDPVDACPAEQGKPSTDAKANGCPDGDGDGIANPLDACPTVKGVVTEDPKTNGCPPDSDADGIVDPEDACPAVKGVANPDPKKNGCPSDKDDDGIIDADDACPDIKGLKTSDPATNGCPGDTDGDTIRDDKDACPNEKGKADPDPTKNGCPVAVRVTETEVIILQQVQFDTNKATIKKVSDPLLDEVAGVFKEHPELTKIEVQGHTDNKGAPKLNTKLSQNRAESVVKALAKRGIVEARMVAKGYGPDKPIGDNNTDEGRQQNRRVQFVILEKVGKDGKTIQLGPKDQPPTAPAPTTQPAPKTAPTPAPKAPTPAPKAPTPAPKAPTPAPKAPTPAPKAPTPAPKAPKTPPTLKK